jgi:hypothetical protein
MKTRNMLSEFIKVASVFTFIFGISSTFFIFLIIESTGDRISNYYGLLGFGMSLGLLAGILGGIIAALISPLTTIEVSFNDPILFQKQIEQNLRDNGFYPLTKEGQLQIYQIGGSKALPKWWPFSQDIIINYQTGTATIIGPKLIIKEEIVKKIKPPGKNENEDNN